ncbi:hydroxyproline-rich glycoprotein family protein [Genlisea aurea]|uniref:Hydroxyproline-rich glycoprotein family protein n=1 Tax=Genlisea aurea TaxID=192259 RepID=S8D2D1_9LAMI|nr:hydroxyproline-rich glycoprotein family protein [Genlisea aurea]
MKTSLKKLQKFAALRSDGRTQKQRNHLAVDELARASQDLNDMRDCYDRLLSAAAATANSVYEFSESLREMGDCLLEKTALNDDEESGKVLLMMGKVQFELQKLVDGYRSHIFQTITVPSESLLNELRVVEEMKKRCDDKRELCEDLKKKHKDKGRLRSSKTEFFPSSRLQEVHEEYEEEANAFIFRMQSLKQGQSRSFLTQASRHHAAQLSLFKRAVRSLEAVEPHVKSLAEQHHIDYQLKDNRHEIGDDSYEDMSDEEEDTTAEYGSMSHDAGELSFDYGRNQPSTDMSESKHSMEADHSDAAAYSPPYRHNRGSTEILVSPRRNSFSFRREARAVSKSAPILPERTTPDSDERVLQLGGPSPSRRSTSYVLPTPDETRSPAASGKLYKAAPNPQNEKWSAGSIILDPRFVLNESAASKKVSLDPIADSYSKKAKRQAFSGPLIGNPWPTNQNLSASGPILRPFPGPSLLRTPLPRPISSLPRISELHELPRPPPPRPPYLSAHSGPIVSFGLHNPTLVAGPSASASTAAVQMMLPRSYSSGQKASSENASSSPMSLHLRGQPPAPPSPR